MDNKKDITLFSLSYNWLILVGFLDCHSINHNSHIALGKIFEKDRFSDKFFYLFPSRRILGDNFWLKIFLLIEHSINLCADGLSTMFFLSILAPHLHFSIELLLLFRITFGLISCKCIVPFFYHISISYRSFLQYIFWQTQGYPQAAF